MAGPNEFAESTDDPTSFRNHQRRAENRGGDLNTFRGSPGQGRCGKAAATQQMRFELRTRARSRQACFAQMPASPARTKRSVQTALSQPILGEIRSPVEPWRREVQ